MLCKSGTKTVYFTCLISVDLESFDTRVCKFVLFNSTWKISTFSNKRETSFISMPDSLCRPRAYRNFMLYNLCSRTAGSKQLLIILWKVLRLLNHPSPYFNNVNDPGQYSDVWNSATGSLTWRGKWLSWNGYLYRPDCETGSDVVNRKTQVVGKWNWQSIKRVMDCQMYHASLY